MDKRVSWIKNTQNNSWFDLLRLNVDSPYFTNLYGIYVVWYISPGNNKVIKIGSGYIGERLKAEKSNPEVLRYSQQGQIKVTWIIVEKESVPGIISYLNEIYTPLTTESYNANKISVNRIGD